MMRFLLNMNLLRGLCEHLQEQGFGCRHVGDLGMARAGDMDIIAEARRRNEVILTHDLDCGHLLAFSGESKPSVVIFRMRNIRPDNLYRRFTQAWQDIEKPLSQGAVVIIEDASVRIRMLPIVQEEEG